MSVMQDVFDAIVAALDGDSDANIACRAIVLNRPIEARGTPPYVNCEITENEEPGTWNADHEDYTIAFTLCTNRPDAAAAWDMREKFTAVFDDCDLSASSFITCMFDRTGATGPEMVDGLYQTTVSYHVLVEIVD
jgi:hypothetical protein